jgi:multiple sugar transport system permease protein
MATATQKARPAPAQREGGRTWRRPSFEARMLTPALIVLVLVSIFPFVYIIAMSLSQVRLIGGISFDWVGLDNWSRLFSDSAVWGSWLRTIVFFVLSVGLQMFLGIGIALAIYEMRRGRNIVTSLVLMPMFMAPVIVGLLGRFLTDSTYGLYAWGLDKVGLYNGDILGNTTSAFLAVTLMDVWE